MPYKNPLAQKAAQAAWYQRCKGDPEAYAKHRAASTESKRQKQLKRKAAGEHRENLSARRKDEAKQIDVMLNETKSRGCSCCDEKDHICLDLHHLDPKQKSFGLARARNRGLDPQAVLAEIRKCIVLCKNCHSKFHAGRFEL